MSDPLNHDNPIFKIITPNERQELPQNVPGYFKIEQASGSFDDNDDALKEYIRYVNRFIDGYQNLIDDGTDLSKRKFEARTRLFKKLKDISEDLVSSEFEPFLLIRAAREVGIFNKELKNLEEAAETVEIICDDDRLAYDLRFNARGLSEAQQRLLIDVGRALTVVRVVTAPTRFIGVNVNKETEEALKRKRDQYVRRLALNARSSRDSTDAAFARLALEAFKDEFVAMEADTVKNQYIRKLGIRSLIVAVVFLILWGLSVTILSNYPIAVSTSPFFLTAVGACGGTWLSFAIRRVVLGFSDLALLEDDRLKPFARVFFVIGLTWLLGMFLESGIINAEMNGIRMTIGDSGMVCLLIGAMCGIAERSLAGAVGKRSEEFVSRLNSKAIESLSSHQSTQ